MVGILQNYRISLVIFLAEAERTSEIAKKVLDIVTYAYKHICTHICTYVFICFSDTLKWNSMIREKIMILILCEKFLIYTECSK